MPPVQSDGAARCQVVSPTVQSLTYSACAQNKEVATLRIASNLPNCKVEPHAPAFPMHLFASSNRTYGFLSSGFPFRTAVFVFILLGVLSLQVVAYKSFSSFFSRFPTYFNRLRPPSAWVTISQWPPFFGPMRRSKPRLTRDATATSMVRFDNPVLDMSET